MKNFLIRCILYLLKLLGYKQIQSNFGGLKFMYVVKADNPDVGFNVSFVVTDSEGHEVSTDSYNVFITSDNEEAVSLELDETGLGGVAHFGSPGLANVNVTVEDLASNLLGSFGAQFTVTAGDPAAVAGGAIIFDGLLEVTPEVPEVPETPEEPETPEFPDEEEPIIP